MSGSEERRLALVSFGLGGRRFAVEARFVAAMERAEGYELLLAGPPPLRRRLAVEGPVELLSLAASRIFPLPRAVEASCTIQGLRALALADDGLLLVLDARPLLPQPESPARS